MRGTMDGIVADYSFPCPVRWHGGFSILQSKEELAGVLMDHRDDCLARGLADIEPILAAVELPQTGRFRAWSRWRYDYQDGQEIASVNSVYYLTFRPDHGLRIEMVNSSGLSSFNDRNALYQPAFGAQLP